MIRCLRKRRLRAGHPFCGNSPEYCAEIFFLGVGESGFNGRTDRKSTTCLASKTPFGKGIPISENPQLFKGVGVSPSIFLRTGLKQTQLLMKKFPFSLIAAGILVPGSLIAQAPDHDSAPVGSRETPARDGMGKRDMVRQFLEMWKSVDLDQDGFISNKEFGELPRLKNLPEEKRENLFKRLDNDKDGKLSREELGKMARPQNGQGSPMPRLWELDVDKSGGVSMEEFKAGGLFGKLPPEKQDGIFRRLDTDRDGVITPKDKPEHPHKRDGENPHPGRPGVERPDGSRDGMRDGPRMEPRQMIRQRDKDGDGALSFEEFRAGPMIKDLDEDAQEGRFEEMDRNHDQKISAEDFDPLQSRGEGKHPNRPGPPAGPPPAPPAE